ncbi:uncharacterized protein LOC135381813 [Ornithodoros turicata]|uniref:uncharacterized protein LOC135381813 n=1 Tax=Ornithodoros turicata TaxID=34597 RepID=UPI0031388DCB
MAKRIEVTTSFIGNILSSKESDDVKVQLILQALYRILKQYGFDPYDNKNKASDATNDFDYLLLSPEVDIEEAERVISESKKALDVSQASRDAGREVKPPKLSEREATFILLEHAAPVAFGDVTLNSETTSLRNTLNKYFQTHKLDVSLEFADNVSTLKTPKELHVSFHSFPIVKALQDKWVVAIKRKPPYNTVTAKVCSLHFKESDFVKNVASGRRMLHSNAVPSIFKFKKVTKERKAPKERRALTPKSAWPNAQNIQDRRPAECHDFATSEEQCETSENDTILTAVPETQSPSKTEEEMRMQKKDELIESLQKSLQVANAEIARLERELLLLKEKHRKLEEKHLPFSVERFKGSDDDIQFYTGLPSYAMFKNFLTYLDPGERGCNIQYGTSSDSISPLGRPHALSMDNELFLTLVRLRVGLFQQDLAHRFSVTQATISRILSAWINHLYLKLSALPQWPSREIIQKNMPVAFKEEFPSTRVIIDATEIKCQVPSSFVLQSETYSTYKSSNTLKSLIGVSPDGYLTFVSSLYTGSISDKELVKKSGLLSLKFEEGDSIMADKGFRIQDLLNPLKIGLNIPPFTTQGKLTKEEVLETQKIASLRIHVERRIQRIKTYHIFDSGVPITLCPLVNQMWTVCALLSNYQSPIMKTYD